MFIGVEIPDIKSVSPSEVIARGDKGLAVKLVQEWLTLHGYPTAIDSDFGPATQMALASFRKNVMKTTRLERDSLGQQTWVDLWHPMHNCLKGPTETGAYYGDFGGETLYFAWMYLTNNAHEIGQNQGPWVRLFFSRDPVNGLDGPEFSWCGAFVRFCISQAIQLLKLEPDPHQIWSYEDGWSCDKTAEWAIRCGLLSTEANPDTVKPGSVFLIRKSEHDWVHTGFVESYDHKEGVITTIEGNTSRADADSFNGVAVARRYRSVKNLNFITGYGTEPKNISRSDRPRRQTKEV